jgi:hypothetical protein
MTTDENEIVSIKVILVEAEADALAQLCKRFGHDDAERFSSSFDGEKERDAMIDGMGVLRRALAKAGFAPR